MSEKKKFPRDLTGLKFDKLEVLNIDPEKTRYGKTYWKCMCVCGQYKSLSRSALIGDVNGITKSCGCFGLQKLVEHRRKNQEDTKDRLHSIWLSIHKRCYDSNNKMYGFYGGAGVSVCERWGVYENFFDDMKESYGKHAARYGEKNTSLDRISNTGNYEPNNCHWVTIQKEIHNRKTTQVIETKKVSFNLYQYLASTTAQYPFAGENPYYVVLGLGGETGEVCEKFKKIMRDKNGVISQQDREEISKELGDVLWYLSQICEELGITLKDVAIQNLAKLHSRKQRGKIAGSGDNR